MPKRKTPYWWNARHSARAVPEKRVIVVAKPVGDARLNECIDSPCDRCGYQICNCAPCSRCGDLAYYCRGDCAPAASAPVAPESVVASDGFAIGQRVRLVRPELSWAMYVHFQDGKYRKAEAGEVGTVVGRSSVRFDASTNEYGDQIFTNWRAFEPAPSPEAVEGESDEALLLRCGWHCDDRGAWIFDGFTRVAPTLPHLLRGEQKGLPWFAHTGLWHPTLLTAACAALSITLHLEPESGQVYAYEGPMRVRAACLCVVRGDLEAGARAALIAFHEKGGAK